MRDALLLLLATSFATAGCHGTKTRPKSDDDDDTAKPTMSAPMDDESRLRAHLAEVAAKVTSAPTLDPTFESLPPAPSVRSNRYGIKGPANSPDPRVAQQRALQDALEFGMIGVRDVGAPGPLATASAGVLGGSRSKPPQVRVGGTSVSGKLAPEVIQRVVRQNFGRFRLCYENGLRSNPSLSGRVYIEFTIDKSGAVAAAASGGGTTLPDSGVVDCVARSFGALSFPAPESGVVKVTYPFSFAPGDATLNGKPLAEAASADVEAALAKAGCTDVMLSSSAPTTFTAKKDGRSFTITFVGKDDTALTEAQESALQAAGALRRHAGALEGNFILAVVDGGGDRTEAQKLLDLVVVQT